MKEAHLGRLGGALLLHSGGSFYLIGNLKEPCDFRAQGFVAPEGELDACVRPFVKLEALEGTRVRSDALPIVSDLPGDALAEIIAKRMLIMRNGSVSDRLWRLIIGADPEATGPAAPTTQDVSWLVHMPHVIWGIVRDTVLRCS